ncbi:hypothetical protein BO71DRAFT_436426 [Aspergillus ellipticus CBS 707.79]|uniref:Uncharacterized protein n=1 Tax=Aspergillus ellipticus CBS 707.79 TaxID=1448320 RepID=A0A319D9L6_9EURO|nr:hypothetical protein BO71DRAFT_436426 [Aspergillus ellipticus CBS 707.79]
MSQTWNRECDLESFVAFSLEEHEIPSCIWSEAALSIYGLPMSEESDLNSTAWIIPDILLGVTCLVLHNKKFSLCVDRNCDLLSGHGFHPPPDMHIHVKPDSEHGGITHDLTFYRKSRVFWAFPDPPLGAPAPDDPTYMLVTDARLPEHPDERGRQPTGNYPVKILTPARYIEGTILLALRDLVGSANEFHWSSVVQHLWELVADEENDLVTLDDLSGPFGEHMKHFGQYYFFKDLSIHENGRKYIFEVHSKMKEFKKLPPAEVMNIANRHVSYGLPPGKWEGDSLYDGSDCFYFQ